MGGIIIACLAALYAFLFLFFIIGLLKTHRYKGSKATPSVSVVVPMRNEEEFAERTLHALDCQDYAGEWEVICVDDRSTDRTLEILEKFAATHPRFRVLSLPHDLPQDCKKRGAFDNGCRLHSMQKLDYVNGRQIRGRYLHCARTKTEQRHPFHAALVPKT